MADLEIRETISVSVARECEVYIDDSTMRTLKYYLHVGENHVVNFHILSRASNNDYSVFAMAIADM